MKLCILSGNVLQCLRMIKLYLCSSSPLKSNTCCSIIALNTVMCFHTDQLSVNVSPPNAAFSAGETAQFTATASGVRMATFTYEWRKRGSRRLPNKVSGVYEQVLTIPNLVDSDGGLYYCTVTNEWNSSVVSDDIALAVEGTYITCIQNLT